MFVLMEVETIGVARSLAGRCICAAPTAIERAPGQ
jgi:hypothetical protein